MDEPLDASAAGRAGHVIVCGLGSVGVRVVEQLQRADVPVVVVDDDPDPRLLRAVTAWGVGCLDADPRRAATLEAAGVRTAVALVGTAENDLDNLEVALLGRRLRADLRVVVQLSNPAVGRAVSQLTGPTTVLDVAGLTAPAIAESCLDLRSRPVAIAGAPLVLQELRATASGTLRSLFGDLAPIAVVPADGGEMAICPGRDEPVRADDRVFVMGTDEQMDEPRPGGAVRAQPHHRRLPRFGLSATPRYLRSLVTESDRPLRLTLVALLLVAAASVVVLVMGYRQSATNRSMGVLDAAYFTTETLTTVGFGDFNFANQPGWVRVFAIALMVVGATVVTIVYAMITNLLVSRRISQSLGRQLATRMRDHVILVGLGSIGLRVLELLVAAGQPVVVLDRDEDGRYLSRARDLRVPVVFGDATVAGNLEGVNIRTAAALAVLTSNDLANIETGLAAFDLLGDAREDVPVVLRVFDNDLADTLEDVFGFSYVRSTEALAAPWFVGAALGLDILQTFYVDQQPMLLARLTVAGSGGLQGRTLGELSARIRVVAIGRGESLEYPPRRDTRLAGGDEAYLVGPYEELLRVLRRDQADA